MARCLKMSRCEVLFFDSEGALLCVCVLMCEVVCTLLFSSCSFLLASELYLPSNSCVLSARVFGSPRVSSLPPPPEPV